MSNVVFLAVSGVAVWGGIYAAVTHSEKVVANDDSLEIKSGDNKGAITPAQASKKLDGTKVRTLDPNAGEQWLAGSAIVLGVLGIYLSLRNMFATEKVVYRLKEQ